MPQKAAQIKTARDLIRYERKRKIAARMISEYKTNQINMFRENYEFRKDILSYKETIKYLNKQNEDLKARLKDETETVYQMNDEDNAQRGIIRAYENVIDKLIKNK